MTALLHSRMWSLAAIVFVCATFDKADAISCYKCNGSAVDDPDKCLTPTSTTPKCTGDVCYREILTNLTSKKNFCDFYEVPTVLSPRMICLSSISNHLEGPNTKARQ